MKNFILKTKFNFYSKKGAKLQTVDLKKAEKYFKLLDETLIELLKYHNTIKLKCKNQIYDLPVSFKYEYFRPFFKMATHRKIKEVNADDTNAVDFDIPLNSEVRSVSDGIITAINKNNTCGENDPSLAGKDNYIYIYDKNQNKIYCYRHVKPLQEINLNSQVKKNQVLGHVDNTGYSITPHLHFVIYKIKNNGCFRLKSEKIKLFFK
ncbi:MAG: M23 family metallopeptidase [Spirochaetes bacterium]|nr:M23 family metallopeptidase [Spirochaetota bacterium]